MSELRERVAKALHDLDEDRTYFIEWESESEADRAEWREQADAALAVFAAWLRERAAQMAGHAEENERLLGGVSRLRLPSNTLAGLAEEIDPKGGDRG